MKKILCVCIGNGDRSPVLAAVLGMMLKSAGHDVVCESAGIGDSAKKGGAAKFGIVAAKRIGLDISCHTRRHVGDLDLASYDLVVCVSDEIAAKMMAFWVPMSKVYTAPIANPWPVQFQQDFDEQAVPAILAAAYRIVTRYFP